MDIIVRMPGRVEIEDVADALDIKAARSHVRCDQDIDRTVAESLQFRDTRRLVNVPVNLAGLVSVALQALVEFAHGRLAIAEDDGALHLLPVEEGAQRFALLARIHLHQMLRDIGRSGRRARDLDRLGIAEEAIRQFLDDGRHGGREEQRLPLRGQFGADMLNVGNEPHVEHAVRFVDHQHVAAIEQDLAPLEQVHQAAGRGDQHVDALFQRLDLIAHLDAANQQSHRKLVIFAVFLEILGHLRRQLARRLQNQAARHQRAGAAMGQYVDHRQHETGGLARAGLRDADNILHHQHRRNRLRLDGCRRVVTGFGHGLQ